MSKEKRVKSDEELKIKLGPAAENDKQIKSLYLKAITWDKIDRLVKKFKYSSRNEMFEAIINKIVE